VSAPTAASVYGGVRVLELATGIAAPYATMFLADHGADVVKVEAPAGDPYRAEAGFQTVNRAKRSVMLDTGVAADRAALDGLVAAADLIVVGEAGRVGELRLANPRAAIVSMPPWGERGPMVAAPATPDLVAAATGIFWNQQSYGEVPVHLVVPVVAYGTGVLGALACAAALFARARDAVAPTYEVSWLAGAAAIQCGDTQVGEVFEARPGSAPMGSKGRVPCYRLFEAGDGKWFFLACGTPRFFERCLELIGRADLIGDERLPNPPWGLMDLDALAFIAPILEEAFASKPRAEWLRILGEADVPAQPVQTREEFLASSVAKANRLVTTVQHPELGPVDMPSVPLVMGATPGSVRGPAPALGAHTTEVLTEWQASHQRIDADSVPTRDQDLSGAAEFGVGAGTDTGPSPATAGPSQARLAPGATRAPLDGLRVIDVSSFIAGPLVSRHLAMLGADVVKVEAPTGDPFRAFGPMFAGWNQSKRSIALDLQSPAGQADLHQLIRSADVFVENFRPGVSARLGATEADLRALRPDLVYLSSTGYGADAAMAGAPAFDPLLQALGGFMASQGGDDEPVFLTVAVHDVITPMISAFGVVSALFHRLRSGAGQRIDTSLAHTTMAAQAAEYTRYAGSPPPLLGGFDFAGPPERTWRESADGTLEFVDGPHVVAVEQFGLVNVAAVLANDLCVTVAHPEWGVLRQPGQLVGGAGPHPARGPLLDEHGAELRAERGL